MERIVIITSINAKNIEVDVNGVKEQRRAIFAASHREIDSESHPELKGDLITFRDLTTGRSVDSWRTSFANITINGNTYANAKDLVVALNAVIGEGFKSPAGGGTAGDTITDFTKTTLVNGSTQLNIKTDKNTLGFTVDLPVFTLGLNEW